MLTTSLSSKGQLKEGKIKNKLTKGLKVLGVQKKEV